jgi:hypothetical protein
MCPLPCTMGATSGAETAYPWGESEFTRTPPVFSAVCVTLSLVFCVAFCRLLIIIIKFYVWISKHVSLSPEGGPSFRAPWAPLASCIQYCPRNTKGTLPANTGVLLCHGSLVAFACHTPQSISSSLMTFCNVEERFTSNYFQSTPDFMDTCLTLHVLYYFSFNIQYKFSSVL